MERNRLNREIVWWIWHEKHSYYSLLNSVPLKMTQNRRRPFAPKSTSAIEISLRTDQYGQLHKEDKSWFISIYFLT